MFRGVFYGGGHRFHKGIRRPAILCGVICGGTIGFVQRHMVIDGPPGAVSVCRHTDIASAVRCFAAAGGAVAGLHHIAGLGAGDLNAAGILVLDPPQEPIGEDLPLRVVRSGESLIGAGCPDL